MNHPLSDAQIHRNAVAFAAKNGVSYSESLDRVATIATHSNSNFGEFSDHAGGISLEDSKLHAAAVRFAAEKGISYSEALERTAPTIQGAAGGFSESFRPTHVSPGDNSLHLAATAFMNLNGVSYSEALSRVHGEVTASFSENQPTSETADLLARQPIEVFRAGSHTGSTGMTLTFSQSDISAMARNYDPAIHEAPLTLGHPVDDKPAFGWVKSLHATPDGRLMMLASQIDPAFAESVKQGRFKKRSAAFYPPKNPNNPIPGTWYLKHIAWLGSMPPAVKGMADIGFSAGSSDGLVSFEI